MNVDLGIWGRLSRVMFFLMLLAAVCGAFVINLPNVRQNEQFRRRILSLETQIQQEEQTARNLRASIEAMRKDPRTVERRARETLRVGRTNETILVFEAPVAGGRIR
jgi:cell division protein FtsB